MENMTDEEFLQHYFPNMINVKIFRPGEAFGEIALITKSKRYLFAYVIFILYLILI